MRCCSPTLRRCRRLHSVYFRSVSPSMHMKHAMHVYILLLSHSAGCTRGLHGSKAQANLSLMNCCLSMPSRYNCKVVHFESKLIRKM